MIEKINHKSLVEQVAEQIEQLIEEGHWVVGGKIPPEMELMEEFDVSRNTLREAIRALVHAGLLKTRQGVGTIVHSSSALGVALTRRVKKSTMLETIEVRLALEKQAAQSASNNRTEDELAHLEECLNSCRDAAEHNELNTFITSDIQFHKSVVQASGNQLLIDLYEHMTGILYSFVHDFMAMDPPFQIEEKLHLGLFKAIQKQDKETAATYVENDMDILKKNIMKETSCG